MSEEVSARDGVRAGDDKRPVPAEGESHMERVRGMQCCIVRILISGGFPLERVPLLVWGDLTEDGHLGTLPGYLGACGVRSTTIVCV